MEIDSERGFHPDMNEVYVSGSGIGRNRMNDFQILGQVGKGTYGQVT
jgi:hypothetical protein